MYVKMHVLHADSINDVSSYAYMQVLWQVWCTIRKNGVIILDEYNVLLAELNAEIFRLKTISEKRDYPDERVG